MVSLQGKEQSERDSQINDLKVDIASLREEVRHISSLILGDRLESVEKNLRVNHLKVYVDRETNLIDESVSRCLNGECSNHGLCQKTFTKSIAATLNNSLVGDIGEVLERIDAELVRIEGTLAEKLGKSCAQCYGNVRDELIRHRDALNQISSPAKRGRGRDSGVDLEKISEQVLKPLASPVRLKILTSLYKGRRSFTELASETGLRGGHLIFHMNQLVKSGFIVQDGRKGDYVATEKGLSVLEKLGSLLDPYKE